MLLFAIAVVSVRSINLQSLSCQNQYGTCNEDILLGLQSLVGNRLIGAHKDISKILTNDRRVESFAVHYKPFTSIHVDYIEKSAQFALENREYQTYAILDNNGTVIELVETSVLPSVVTANTLPNIGEKVPDDVYFAIRLASKLRPQYEMSTFVLKNKHLEVSGIDDYTLLFPLDGDIDLLIGSMTLILSRLKQSQEEFRIEDNRKIREIDLRFKNPVLRY